MQCIFGTVSTFLLPSYWSNDLVDRKIDETETLWNFRAGVSDCSVGQCVCRCEEYRMSDQKQVIEPAIYLIDKDNSAVKGPVDFGTFVTKEDFVSDYMVKETQYRALLFPARLEIVGEECNICISVKKIAPICPNSSTFNVGVGMVFKGLPGAVSPYKVDDPFEFRFVDKKTGVDPEVKLEFDARIVGVLVKSK